MPPLLAQHGRSSLTGEENPPVCGEVAASGAAVGLFGVLFLTLIPIPPPA